MNKTIVKYALIDEKNDKIVLGLGDSQDDMFFAPDAYMLADVLRPGWREEGLKLWLRVANQ
jgi:hypothetical protein